MTELPRTKQLTQFLTGLPPRHVRKLALALEQQRSKGVDAFPHEAILEILRPSLAAMRMPRVMTPHRVVCAPFEDLLRTDDPDVKQIGLVSRASISEMWSLLRELAPDRLTELSDAYTEAQRSGDHAATGKISRDLWKTAAETLKGPLEKAASNPIEYKSFTKRVGGSRRAEDLKEIQAVLSIAEQVEHVKALLPRRPIRDLSPDHINIVARIYQELAAENDGREFFLMMVVLGRLEQKFELMKILRHFSPKMDDTIATRTDLRIAGDLVIDALEMEAEEIWNAAGDAHDEDSFMRLVYRFATNFNGITREIGIRRDGEWGQRMYACRARVSEAIERSLLAAAPNKVLSVLPSAGGQKGLSVAAPDFRIGIDVSTYQIAERRARAVADTARMAEQLGVTKAVTRTVDVAKRELNRYGAMLIEILPKIPPAHIDNATSHLSVTVRLIELLVNTNEADLLRRRGMDGLSKVKLPPDSDDGLQASIASGAAIEILRPDSPS